MNSRKIKSEVVLPSYSKPANGLEIFLGSSSAVQEEVSCELKITKGIVPNSLDGTLYRNGPGRFSIGADTYSHPFDGDGLVSSFKISAGKIHYRNAYVKTAEYLKEQVANRMLFRGFGSNLPGGILKNIFRTRFKNAANTNVISHAGKLLALWEGGWPHQLCPKSLTTLSRFSFHGKLENKANPVDRWMNPQLPFSAHPKVDPATGILYNFGLAFGLKNRLMLYRVDPDGEMTHPRYLHLKELSFIHDFLITSNSKAIFFCTPVHFDLFSMLTGICTPAAGMTGDPSAVVKILVVDLNGPPGEIPATSIEIFEAPYSFIFHHVNAFEDEDQIHIYCAEMESFPNSQSAQQALRGVEVEYPLTHLVKYTLKSGQKNAAKQILPMAGFELPRLEESQTGLAFSYFFAAGVKSKKDFPFMNQIQKISIEGKIDCDFTYSEGLVGEPVAVSTKDQKFILSVCYNHEIRKSELIILEANDLGLIAKAQIPHSQPLGFHGNWVENL